MLKRDEGLSRCCSVLLAFRKHSPFPFRPQRLDRICMMTCKYRKLSLLFVILAQLTLPDVQGE